MIDNALKRQIRTDLGFAAGLADAARISGHGSVAFVNDLTENIVLQHSYHTLDRYASAQLLAHLVTHMFICPACTATCCRRIVLNTDAPQVWEPAITGV